MHLFYVTLNRIAILTKMKPADTEVFMGSKFLPLVEHRAQLSEGELIGHLFIHSESKKLLDHFCW